MPSVAADYYDGHSARAHPVTLSLADGRLVVAGEHVHRAEALAALHVSEPMGAAPRLVKFLDGAHCEVHDHAGFAVLLASSGYRDGWVVRMQERWRWAVLAVMFSVAAIAAGYRWGLPAASGWLAFQVPEKLLVRLGDSTLSLLDDNLFAPSRLPAARQQALRAAFDRLAAPGAAKPAYHLLYRDGGRIGANAFALPDGTIVVTDQLVALAARDEEVLAVLAHELGHLDRRHGLRMLIQSSIVGVVVAWYMGDVSNIAAGLPTMLLEAGYSRDHEREADQYGAALLRHNGLSPDLLAGMLEKLETAHHAARDEQRQDPLDYLSSHPITRERVQALRGEGG